MLVVKNESSVKWNYAKMKLRKKAVGLVELCNGY